MDSQLKDRVDPTARFVFDLFQGVDIPRIEYQRLFADGVGAYSQSKPYVGVVEIVRGADTDPVYGLIIV